ncbi:hypothetical protein C0993_012231 [Termitomyces sp. T159_Od127]|nr:hypothetical protein C0993_012231 [Termitomyces sp. T159_Od127]
MYPPGTTINDMGGGVGLMAMKLVKAFPNLQLKLQDLPDRISQAKTEVWPRLLPSAIAEKRIEFKSMDFLVDSPIADCDVYYLNNIIHDWPDEACVQVLGNIRAVLKPGARVLINEYILQHVHRMDTSDHVSTEAPEPMLPNYGVGRIRQYNADLLVMVLQNGIQRTLKDLIDIGNKANLQFVKLWHVGETSVVEFEHAET